VLAGDQPFLRHEFLAALESCGCVSERAGWIPQHLTLWQDGSLAGAMPLYLKLHSYGEYVFDWSWADAYQQHGLDYYPKLVNAIPFTPVTGRRLLGNSPQVCALLLQAALTLARELEVSSLHCLFPDQSQAAAMQAQGMLLRSGVQFHWRNRGYADFDAFLAGMSHAKRKNIRQERRKVREAGIVFEQITGRDASPAHWEFFHACYETTYHRHRSTPYLNLDFFRELGRVMADQVLLVIASRAGRPVASALNLFDAHTLYGRYWGSTEDLPGLHFETCYYQAIEFCIARGIATFEGGAQGEHKVARGFLPVPTWSAHWLAHPQFSRAVEEFLARETQGIEQYMSELNEHSPFKNR
jgi:predicted N-acyltransferase